MATCEHPEVHAERHALWTLCPYSLFLASCSITPVDTSRQPPEDWPALKISVEVTDKDPARVCKLQPARRPLAGCALVDFNKGICVVYVRYRLRPLLEHERLHCLGYDHPGETTFRAAWEAFKKTSEVRQSGGVGAVSLSRRGEH